MTSDLTAILKAAEAYRDHLRAEAEPSAESVNPYPRYQATLNEWTNEEIATYLLYSFATVLANIGRAADTIWKAITLRYES